MSDSGEQDPYEQALREVELFVLDPQRVGIPTRWFGAVALLGVGLGFASSFWVGILILGVLLPLLYHAHKDDPRAADVWVQYLRDRTTGCNPTKITFHKVEISE